MLESLCSVVASASHSVSLKSIFSTRSLIKKKKKKTKKARLELAALPRVRGT